jgi:ABC-type sugar transport system ATPase subunit
MGNTTEGQPYVVEMNNISKDFPGVRALSDINFRLRAGELRGLVGKNGAGKSTLMNVLTVYIPAIPAKLPCRASHTIE